MLEREPPALPPDYIYTSHWCEENIYKLIAYFNSRDDCTAYWDIFAVFISNPSRSVALWGQKSANTENDGIPMYYSLRNTQSWVYDLDTRLPVPCVASGMMSRISRTGTITTFRQNTFGGLSYTNGLFLINMQGTLELVSSEGSDGQIGVSRSIFRVIQADKFLDNFASDRSHMLILGDTAVGVCQYIKPPPPYPPICGKKAGERNIANNLMSSFVTMVPSDKMYGVVLDFSAFETWALQ